MSVLVSFSGNPLPVPFRQGHARTPDGFALRHAVFRSTAGPCKGTVIVLHGRNECIEKYGETILDLLARGFDVCTFDWRGQGGSTRFFRDARRGYVDHFDQYVGDLHQMVGEVFLAEARPPFFMLAHSMGALVALLAAPDMANRIDRMVLSAPLLALGEHGLSAGTLTAMTSVLSYLGLGRVYTGLGPRGIAGIAFSANRLTGDPVRFARMKAVLDPDAGLGLGGPTAGWLRAALAAMRRVHDPAVHAAIRVPTLIVAAGADTVVSNAAIEAFGRRMRAASSILVPGARHELLNESDRFRDQFLAAFDAFVPGRARVGAAA